MAKDIKPFGIGSHDPIFNSVMNHFHEVACARRPAVKVSLLCSSLGLFPAGGAGDVAHSRSQALKYRIEMFHGLFRTADHQAVAPIEPPGSPARSNIQIVNAFGEKRLGTADVIDIVRVPSVDEDISLL